MSRRSIALAFAFPMLLMSPCGALAENRVALVIGNSAYQSATALPNPTNDARAVAELLQSAGFEVMPVTDLSQTAMRNTISEFAARVASKGKDTVAIVYYAGHGLQVGGENFLVPVDATIKSETEVALQSVRFDDLMNALEAVPTKARIVILDACRNNPFEEMKKTVGRGLAMVNAPVGSVVAYSTSPGTEAEDGRGRNSPFTAAFIAAAKQPGVPVEQIFKNVRLAVHTATEGRQTPWEVLSLTSNFSFFPAAGSPASQPVVSAPAAPAPASGQTPAATPVSLTTAPATAVDATRTAANQAARAAHWRKVLRGLSPQQAYELVVSEDDVDGYREFLALYPSAPQVARLRVVVDRRTEMLAWYTAVTGNSVGSYKYFLARYGSSDLAATARTLMQRAATRSLLASTDPAALGCNCGGGVVAPALRRAEPKAPTPKKATRSAGRSAGSATEAAEPVSAPVGIGGVGIGIGIGGMGGGMGPRSTGGSMGGGRSMGGSAGGSNIRR